MTKADDIHAELVRIQQQDNAEQTLAVAAEFYRRVNVCHWRISDVHWIVKDGIAVTITHLDGKQNVRLDYDGTRNVWRLGGHSSDADIAEFLGVPMAYLQGALEVLESVWLQAQRISKELKAARESRKKSIDARRRMAGRIARLQQKLDQPKCASSIAKDVRRQCGRKTAVAIAAVRDELEFVRRAYKTWNVSSKEIDDLPESLCGVPDLFPVEVKSRPKLCGIYFLVRDSVVVYVGQSVDVASRLATHSTDPTKDFTSAFVKPCKADVLDRMEREWIDRLMPVFNRDPSTKQRRRALELSGSM